MNCPYCGYVENSAGPTHVCSLIRRATLGDELHSDVGRLLAENATLKAEVEELRQRDRLISNQLERRADGMDPLAVHLRAEVERKGEANKIEYAEHNCELVRATLQMHHEKRLLAVRVAAIEECLTVIREQCEGDLDYAVFLCRALLPSPVEPTK